MRVIGESQEEVVCLIAQPRMPWTHNTSSYCVYNDASFYGNNTMSYELHQDYTNSVSYYNDNNTQGLTYCWEPSAVANLQPTVANGWHDQFISMEILEGEDIPPPVEECGCMSGLVEDSEYEDQLPIQETGHSNTQEMVTGKNSF